MRAMAPNGRIRRKGTNTTSKNSWLFSYKPNLQKRYLGWLICFDHRWDALKHIETMAKALLTCYWTFLGTTSDFRADSRRPCTAGNSCTAKRGKLFESQFSGELKQENVEIGDEFLRNVYILHYFTKMKVWTLQQSATHKMLSIPHAARKPALFDGRICFIRHRTPDVQIPSKDFGSFEKRFEKRVSALKIARIGSVFFSSF